MRAYHVLWCASAATAGTGCLAAVFGRVYGLVPFLGNILSTPGILGQGEDSLSIRPPIFPIFLRVGFTWFLLFSLAVFACRYLNRISTCPPVCTIVFGLFSFAYIPLLLPGALIGLTFDRYMLPLLPLAVISLLQCWPCGRVVPVSAWACVVVFAFYGIATTHDYFSDLRARGVASQKLQNSGVARRHISAGVEYDGWLQLELAGTIRPVLYSDRAPMKPDEFWFWKKATALTPEYVVLSSPIGRVPAHAVVTIPFYTWLPPFRRAAVGIRRADLGASSLAGY